MARRHVNPSGRSVHQGWHLEEEEGRSLYLGAESLVRDQGYAFPSVLLQSEQRRQADGQKLCCERAESVIDARGAVHRLHFVQL